MVARVVVEGTEDNEEDVEGVDVGADRLSVLPEGTVSEFEELGSTSLWVLLIVSAVLGLRAEMGLMTEVELPERVLFEQGLPSWTIGLRLVELMPFMAAWISSMIFWGSLSLPPSSASGSKVDEKVVG